LPADPSEYETQYIAAFDAGAPHPAVPLMESHYNQREPVQRILHENVLFHRSFGLRLRSEANETADHLRHQLEFTAHLYRMESEAERDVREQVCRARHEFAERHLLSWLPRACEKAAQTPFPWVSRYLDLTLAAARVAAGQGKAGTGTAPAPSPKRASSV
jgi:DMSO reductase family type II enzyme chaperone